MHAQALSAEFLPAGTKLGRYELIKKVATGGMAELYLARSTGIQGFEKLVALKRILPQHACNEELVTMFLDEARLAATLHHANVAQVYDIGQSPHGLFFTMEFVHGEDVRNLLKNRVRVGEMVPLGHVLSIVAGTAAGLHAAHEKTNREGELLGVVHRDVSPANILVSYDGCVKLIDFGVAKGAEQKSETRVGTLKGKIAYMSPEQCLGDPVDRRTDVFALGIVLYELTTGTRLFRGKNEFTIMKKIVAGDVLPPSKLRADYPMKLEEIVLKALSRDPEQRHATAQELQIELEKFARDSGNSISTVELGRYMRSVFPERLASWDSVLHGGDDEPEIEICRDPQPAFLDDIEDGELVDSVPVCGSPVAMETWMFSADPSDGVPDLASRALSGPAPKGMVPETRQHRPYGERPVWMLPLVGLCALGALVLVLVIALGSAERTATEDDPRANDERPARSVGAPLAPLETPVQLEQAAPVETSPARSRSWSKSKAKAKARKAAKPIRPTVTTRANTRKKRVAPSNATRSSKPIRRKKSRSQPKAKTWNADSALPPM